MTKKFNFQKTLTRMRGVPVMIIGDLMVDHFIRGKVDRLSPEAPVPVVDVKSETFLPGGAGNVACNMAGLSASPLVVSVVGQDHEGELLKRSLLDQGVRVEGVYQDSNRPTIRKTRVLADHQQVVRFDREVRTPLSSRLNGILLEKIQDNIRSVKGVVFSDYGKGVVNPTLLNKVLTLARRHKKFVMVDPKVEHFLRYRRVDCLTPNLKEATEGMRSLPPKSDREVDALGKRILKKLGCQSVLITRGERGMSLYETKGRVIHIPSQALEVFDVTGAGDTVIAAFSLAKAVGCSNEEAMLLSNMAAGVVVAKLGTAVIQMDELKRAAARWRQKAR